jgi:hypothetical protein
MGGSSRMQQTLRVSLLSMCKKTTPYKGRIVRAVPKVEIDSERLEALLPPLGHLTKRSLSAVTRGHSRTLY